MLEAVNRYYDAERGPLPMVMLAAVLIIALGVMVIRRGAPFAKGVAWSLVVISALLGVGAFAYSLQVGPKHVMYVELLAKDPAAFRARELEHLGQVAQTFERIIPSYLVVATFAFIGAGLAKIRARSFFVGLGVGLGVLALLSTALELNNQARAAKYEDEVEAFRP